MIPHGLLGSVSRWTGEKSLKKYNANTNAFPVGGQLNKAENASLTKRQIAEEM